MSLLGEDGATVFGVDDQAEDRPLIIRKSADLSPTLAEIAKALQEEYTQWIKAERELRDKHAAAVEQVAIRERLLKELAILMEQAL
jgi:hypothetical protein